MGHDLAWLLTISIQSCVLYPRRSGLVGKGNHSRPIHFKLNKLTLALTWCMCRLWVWFLRWDVVPRSPKGLQILCRPGSPTNLVFPSVQCSRFESFPWGSNFISPYYWSIWARLVSRSFVSYANGLDFGGREGIGVPWWLEWASCFIFFIVVKVMALHTNQWRSGHSQMA